MATPWEIGRAHWNQLDLYTKSASIEDDGYGVGPRVHPEVGSYAYVREAPPREERGRTDVAEQAAREAWPWRNYHAPNSTAHAPRYDGTTAPRAARRDVQVHEESAVSRFFDRLVNLFAGRSRDAIAEDERIRADVAGALAARRDVDVRAIEVIVSDGCVTLKGSVPTRLMKDRAEESARSCVGVARVSNKLHVRHDDDVRFLMPLKLLAV